MKKIITILLLSMGIFLWFHGHSVHHVLAQSELDPGMNQPLPENPDQAGSPDQQLDPGMNQPLPENPDQAGSPDQPLDPGMNQPLPENPDQAADPYQNSESTQSDQQQNQSANAGPWICGQDADSDCTGLCDSSGYDATGVSSTDSATIQAQCPGSEWHIACQCQTRAADGNS